MLASAARRDDSVEAIRSVRAVRRRELLRISAADLCVPFDVAEVADALTDLTDATLEAALSVATAAVERERGIELPTRMAIVAMGRYGGYEMGYGSDADVMFVHEPLPGADHAAGRDDGPGRRERAAPAAGAARDRSGARGRRRPASRGQAGSAGALAGLLRGVLRASGRRCGRRRRCCAPTPLVGDPGLEERFTALIDPLRFPDGGLGARRRGGDPADQGAGRRPSGCRAAPTRPPTSSSAAAGWPTSSGRCSCSRCSTPAAYRTCAPPRPLEALRRRSTHGLLAAADAEALADRLAARQPGPQRDRAGARSSRPTSSRTTAASAPRWRAILGYGPGETAAMVNDYLRTARRARAVVDRVFWGEA